MNMANYSVHVQCTCTDYIQGSNVNLIRYVDFECSLISWPIQRFLGITNSLLDYYLTGGEGSSNNLKKIEAFWLFTIKM